jgi:vacuolar-type H+-ATPase subunit D/Vma8
VSLANHDQAIKKGQSHDTKISMRSEIIMKKRHPRALFTNTQQAVKYGAGASLDDMAGKLAKLISIIINYQSLIVFNNQMFNEAMHAFKKDAWFEKYCIDEAIEANREANAC